MTRRHVWVLAIGACFVAGVASETAGEDAVHKYVGADKCKTCHMAAAKGNQYGQWLGSKHANAFTALASDQALAFAKERGLSKPPQQEDACLKCHVSGWGKPATAFMPTYKKEQGVSCESCHGPGSDYWKMDIMKDKTKAVAAGLIIPDEKTCTGCHNSESPTFKGFVFKEMFAKIAHPNPAKKKS